MNKLDKHSKVYSKHLATPPRNSREIFYSAILFLQHCQ